MILSKSYPREGAPEARASEAEKKGRLFIRAERVTCKLNNAKANFKDTIMKRWKFLSESEGTANEILKSKKLRSGRLNK